MTLILQVIALVLLLLAGIGVSIHPKISTGWLGLFFWLLSLMLGGVALHTT